MLHEVLLSLYGFPNGIFKKSVISNRFEVSNDMNKIHPGEVNILEEICYFVNLYIYCTDFINQIESSTFPIVNFNKSVYISSLCHGIRQSLLLYETSLLELETKILEDPYTPLSAILNDIQIHKGLLISLSELIKDIKKSKIVGPKIIDFIVRLSLNGDLDIRKIYHKLAHQLLNVFFKQTVNWMVFGKLIDFNDEFFIKTLTNETSTEYDLVKDLIPESILYEKSFEKILHCGKCSILLNNSKYQNKELCNSHDDHSKANNLELSVFFKQCSSELMDLLNCDYSHVCEIKSLINDKIDKVNQLFSKRIWNSILKYVNIIENIELISMIYFVKNEQVFNCFFEKIDIFTCKKLADSNINREIRLAFDHALLCISSTSIDLFELFSVNYQSENMNEIKRSTSTASVDLQKNINIMLQLEYITIKYNPPWPLHVVFTDNIILKLNEIRNTISTIKLLQMRISEVHKEVKFRFKSSTNLRLIFLYLYHVRNFLDRILRFYMVEIVESHLHKLIDQCKLPDMDLYQMKKCVEFFTQNVWSVLTHNKHPILKDALDGIVKNCLEICHNLMVNELVDNESPMHIPNIMNEAIKTFNKLVYLYFVSANSEQYYPLALTLNFNNFLSKVESNMDV